MENTTLSKTINNLPELIKNTHFNISLEGWPATVAVISGCITIISIIAIKATYPKAVPNTIEGAA